MEEKRPQDSIGNLYRGYSIGLSMVSCMAVCLLIGWYVDKYFPGISPFGMVAGGALGIVSMIYVGLKESNNQK